MTLSPWQIIVMILMLALGVWITRYIPLILFPESRPVPKFVVYLGRVLPAAMMGLLLVFCFKGVSFTSKPFGIPEIIGCLVVGALHVWKRNALLSIGVGTLVYILLVNFVFV